MRSTPWLFLTIPLLFTPASTAIQIPHPGEHPSAHGQRSEHVEREIERLTSQLASPDEEARLDAVVRLSALHSAAAASALRSAAHDQSEKVRAAALAGLGQTGDPSLAPFIAASLSQDKSVFVRKTAAYALGVLSGQESIPALIAALRDKDAEVRSAAAVALGEYSDPSVIGALIAALSDRSAFVQEQSARALGRHGRASVEAVPALIKLLTSNGGPPVRLQAAIALGEIGDRAAISVLESAAQAADPYLSSAAMTALKKIDKGRH